MPSYELTILFAALTAAVGMIALNGLPQPYHPVFNAPRFSLATLRQVLPGDRGRRSEDSATETTAFLEGLGAEGVYEVPE